MTDIFVWNSRCPVLAPCKFHNQNRNQKVIVQSRRNFSTELCCANPTKNGILCEFTIENAERTFTWVVIKFSRFILFLHTISNHFCIERWFTTWKRNRWLIIYQQISNTVDINWIECCKQWLFTFSKSRTKAITCSCIRLRTFDWFHWLSNRKWTH